MVDHRAEIKNIYLAGKIDRNDWRHDIVQGLQGATPLKASSNLIVDGMLSDWPILKNAIFGSYHYTGPFFVDGDHCSFHGEGTHGLQCYGGTGTDDDILLTTDEDIEQITGGHGDFLFGGVPYRTILIRCLMAMGRSHLVFAWIDDLTCYGTIAEIGAAYQEDKIIWIAGPRRYRDLEFVYQMASKTRFGRISPKVALMDMLVEHQRLHPHFDSPIEKAFWDEWHESRYNRVFDLTPQYPVGRYRLDFAHIPTMTAIELDGFASHSSTEDIANDRKRQREIEAMGWCVVRFGGKEIHHNVQACALEVSRLIARRVNRKGGTA